MRIKATQDTWLKKQPGVQSSNLPEDEKVFVPAGKEYEVDDIAEDEPESLVSLGYGAGDWYLFNDHWTGLEPEAEGLLPNFKGGNKQETIAAIVKECDRQGLTLIDQKAYVLATTHWETNDTFQPVVEAYWLSEEWRQKNLRYFPFYGRGFVQITWKENYEKFSKIVGEDLVTLPGLALRPNIALFILVYGFKNGSFTGKRLEEYVNPSKSDFVGARRCINGTDKAQEIARLALAYKKQLTSSETSYNPSKKLSVTDITSYMEKKGYRLFKGQGEVNIVYLEGVNPDLTLNDDRPNWFNDLRLIIRYEGRQPQIVGKWAATTEPGYHYTNNPMNVKGAARIQFGQYQAWKVGTHRDHEALVQVSPVTVCRDRNRDMVRKGDELDTGLFAINQHWGYDNPESNIGRASAGCLVGRTKSGHKEFMSIVKSDPRFRSNKNFVFHSAILAGDDI